MRWVVATACWTVLLAPAGAARAGGFGYLYPPAYTIAPRDGLPLEPYCPKPGDLILSSNTNVVWNCCYHLARTGKPGHVAVILCLPDGTPAVLEAGSDCKPVVAVVPLRDWMTRYKGSVWIRRRREPITPEQSCRLTEFALLNDKKPYAILRLLSQLTPLKARGLLRTYFFGKPHGIRDRYFCSELVLEALVWACLLPAETTRPMATYPRDLFYDWAPIPYLNRHKPLEADWEVPARWARTACGKSRPGCPPE